MGESTNGRGVFDGGGAADAAGSLATKRLRDEEEVCCGERGASTISLCVLRGDAGDEVSGVRAIRVVGWSGRTEDRREGAVSSDEMGREVTLEGACGNAGDTGTTGSGCL